MLARKYRASRKDIDEVMRRGNLYHEKHLMMRAVSSEDIHVAFVVPKKLKLGAVLRNKLRRRGYAAFARCGDTDERRGLFVFFFKKGALQCSPEMLEHEVIVLLDKCRTARYTT